MPTRRGPFLRGLVLGSILVAVTVPCRISRAEDLDDARRLLREGGAEERKQALEILVGLNTRRAVNALEDAVRRSLTDLEKLAPDLDALDIAWQRASEKMKDAVQQMWRRKQDMLNAHLEVILEAGRAMERFGSPEAVEAIERGAKSEPLPLLRQFYIRALSRSGRTESLPILLEVADASDARVRALGVRALARYLYHPGVAAKLEDRAEDKVWCVRLPVYVAMAYTPFDVAVPFLVEGIQREEGEIALQIDALLASLTGQSFAGDVSLWKRWWTENERAVRDGTYVRPPEPEAPPEARPTATFFHLPIHSTNVLFAVDYSSSMDEELRIPDGTMNAIREKHGLPETRLGYALAEQIRAIDSLPKGAHFNIVLYGDEARTLSKRPLRVSPSTQRRAVRWLLDQETEWMTNIWAALRESFYDHLERSGGSQRFRYVPDTIVLLTDGYASRGRFQDDLPLQQLVWLWNLAAGTVIHTVGIGDHDQSLLKALSEQTGGLYLDLGRPRTSLRYERRSIPPTARRAHRKETVVLLRRALEVGDWELRVRAVRHAAELGAFAGPVLPLLASALGDEDSEVRDAAVEGLAFIGPLALPDVMRVLGHQDPLAVEAAVRVLQGYGKEASRAVDALVSLLEHDAYEVRAAAANALGAMGREAAAAADALEKAAADEHGEVAEAARRALRAVGGGR